MQIIKRDESKMEFDLNKIIRAILKAMKETDNINEDVAKRIAIAIREELDDLSTVETIQDMVEEKLMEYNYTKAAKAYILYRDKRNKERNKT